MTHQAFHLDSQLSHRTLHPRIYKHFYLDTHQRYMIAGRDINSPISCSLQAFDWAQTLEETDNFFNH